jgi:tetratricopeptide (TPR) repeat protein
VRKISTLLILAVTGCTHQVQVSTTSSNQQEMANVDQATKILTYVAGVLNGLGDYDTVDTNSRDILDYNEAARRALETGVPPSLVSQLNQWIILQAPLADWRRDPLLDTLPDPLKKSPQLQDLETMGFSPPDGIDLRQAIWLRNVSNWAAGETQDDLQRARLLFDWVVRNIQLDPADNDDPPRLAWHALLLGHGTATDRTWLFMLLARQQGLDVVTLAESADGDNLPRPWLPALLHGGELYLFEPALGLPLPGPKREGIATLAEVADDDGLLRQLDLDDEHRYDMTSSRLQTVSALIEASPMYLAQRMALLESQLAGEQKVVLSIDAAALAERLRECKRVAASQLWTLPYERLVAQAKLGTKGKQRLAVDFEPYMVPFPRQVKKKVELLPALWKARVLHLLGEFTGDGGAMKYYQIARPSDGEIARGPALERDRQEELRGRVTNEEWQHSVNRYAQLAPVAKHDASYWLGLIAYERRNYKSATDFFVKRTIDVDPNSPWRAGAYYNLARAYEALGQTKDAISFYRDIESPQRTGNLLRARWLEEKRKL